MGRITKDDRHLIKGLRTDKMGGGLTSFRTRGGLWQVLIVCLKTLTNTGQQNGSHSRGRPRSVVCRHKALSKQQWIKFWTDSSKI